MTERVLRGLPAASGVAVGPALVLREADPPAEGEGGEAEQAAARAALARVAGDLGEAAARLRRLGRIEEAEILEANQLMAEDPMLIEEVERLAAVKPAATAIAEATERQAIVLAGLPDPLLAARAADVRGLGRRAARVLANAPALSRPGEPVILVARDLGPADVADLDLGDGRISGLALAEGAATSHAAIMARAFGLPMAIGLGEAVLDAADGEPLVLDGDAGVATVSATAKTVQAALAAIRRRERRRRELAAARAFPAETVDGRRVRLLCNAGTAADVEAGLQAGAEGVGLLRTELAFLDASSWPSEAEHLGTLAPALASLVGRTATVRTLDFGEDKTPPFLVGARGRGLELMLREPDALAAQLRGILRAGSRTELRVLLPLVEHAEQLRAARAILSRCLAETGWSTEPPRLGAMIETPEAAEHAAELAAEADFLSVGTNDLVQYTLGLDRELPLATAEAAAHPLVLALVARVTEAARAAGLPVEVCGEAAAELPLAGLFVGLGVDELSVSAARIDELRAAIRRLSAEKAAEAARDAIGASSAQEALKLAESAFSGQAGDERGKALDGFGGVIT